MTSAPTCCDPELGESRPARDVVQREAVVHARADHLVAERVELRAHLADLGHDQLLVRAATIRARIVPRALGDDLESPAGGKRHRFGQHAAKLEDFTRLDEPRGAEHGLGLHVIARASLVARAPLRGTALAVRRRLPRLSGRLTCEEKHAKYEAAI